MKFLFAIALFLGVAALATASDSLLKACQPIAVQDDPLTLKTKQPLLVFIHNVSSCDLWVTHPVSKQSVSEQSASAGWSSRLEAHKWSALVVDKPTFELACIESKPGHEQNVPCAGLITMCESLTVKIPATLSGTFWAGENMTLSSLTQHLGNRGFGLTVPAQ